jgi:hypothetical protein
MEYQADSIDVTSIEQTAAAGAAQVEPADAGGPVVPAYKPLGALLVAGGLIDEAQLQEALHEGSRTGERLGEVVVRRQWATEEDVAKALAEQWGLSYVDRASIWFDAAALTRLSREDAQRLEALPTRVEDGRVVVAVAEPTTQRLAALRQVIGEDVVVIVVPKSGLNAGLHSELLGSRNGRHATAKPTPVVEPRPDYAALVVEPRPDYAAPLPKPLPDLPATAPEPVPGTSKSVDDVAALAVQARAVAESIEAQVAALRHGAGAVDELEALRRRVDKLEVELAQGAAERRQLREHLEGMLRLLAGA